MLELNEAFWEYVERNSKADTAKLRLSAHGKEFPFDVDFAITQIECRHKARGKLDALLANKEFLFPTVLSSEQATHFEVSQLHARIIGKTDTLLDMTSGLGVDFLANSKNTVHAVAIDMDPLKTEVLAHNLAVLGCGNAEVVTADSIRFLKELRGYPNTGSGFKPFGAIFVDPARRDGGNSRLFDPAACAPDIVSNWPLLLSSARDVYVKLSPMADITDLLQRLPDVRDVYVVGFKNECKEILLHASGSPDIPAGENPDKYTGHRNAPAHDVRLHCIDIMGISKMERHSDPAVRLHELSLSFSELYIANREERAYCREEDLIEGYLYEPDITVMKAGAWNVLPRRFPHLKTLSPNCHLHSSDILYKEYPGRILKIERILPGNSVKEVRKGRYNVVTRNYPIDADALARKLKVSGADKSFIYGVTAGHSETPLLLVCSKEK